MTHRLIIAIDCDDVLIPTTQYLVDNYNRQFGSSVTLARAHESGNDEWGADRATVFQRLADIQKGDEYARIEPHDEAIAAVRRLASHHELHLITAREPSVEAVTLAMLDQYLKGCFTSIEHVGNARSKGEVCRAVRADVLIDDNIKHLVSALECGVPFGGAIHFGDYPWNHVAVLPDGVAQCHTWQAVETEIAHFVGR